MNKSLLALALGVALAFPMVCWSADSPDATPHKPPVKSTMPNHAMPQHKMMMKGAACHTGKTMSTSGAAAKSRHGGKHHHHRHHKHMVKPS